MDTHPDSADPSRTDWLLARLPDPEPTGSPDPADPDSLLAMLPDPEPAGPTATPPVAEKGSEERLAEAEATLDRLTATVTQLAATIGRMAERPTTSAPAAPVVAGEPATHDELVEWVCWLADRYGVGHMIPNCWAEHPRLVEELDALRLGWLGAVAPGRPGLDSLVWHDYLRRWLDDVFRRRCTIRHEASTARPAAETHTPRGRPIDLAASRYPPGAPPPDDRP